MRNDAPDSHAAAGDNHRLIEWICALQARGYPDVDDRDTAALANQVAARLVMLGTELAMARFGNRLSGLGTEASDVAGEAGWKALAGLARLRLEDDPSRAVAQVVSWLRRQVDWLVYDLARQRGGPQEWWWRATREECWQQHARTWEELLLPRHGREASVFWRELQRHFFNDTYLQFQRYYRPREVAWEREVLLVIKSDVRRWVGRPELPLDPNLPQDVESPEDQALRRDLNERVRACLEELERRDAQRGRLDRQLLELRYLESLRLVEICQVLQAQGITSLKSEAAVHRRLESAKRRLRALLIAADVAPQTDGTAPQDESGLENQG